MRCGRSVSSASMKGLPTEDASVTGLVFCACVLFDVPAAVDSPMVGEREERAGMNAGELEGRVSADWIMACVAEALCCLPLFTAHAAVCPLCAHPGLSLRKRPSRVFLWAQNLGCFENRAMHAQQSAQATTHSLLAR
jgi:hypothetical protein